VTSPATGEPLATARAAAAEDVRAAIDAGAEAFREYRRRPINERAELCRAVARSMLERREAIATDLAMEQGKPLAEALDEVDIAAEMFRAAAENVIRLTGEVIPSSDPAKRVHVTYEPIGVVGEYLSACLAVANAVVWKPARYTPITAANLAECVAAAGVPSGVINVVYGSGPVVAGALLSHPAVTGIGATGSPAMGEALAAAAGTRRLLLELGGKGPAIVLDDADLSRTIPRIAFGCFANAGQICDSTSGSSSMSRSTSGCSRASWRKPGRSGSVRRSTLRRPWARSTTRRTPGRSTPTSTMLAPEAPDSFPAAAERRASRRASTTSRR
jgi:succinate-semialdehyde dehydrogenase/glutarate-semialdehyde dehydrogenase